MGIKRLDALYPVEEFKWLNYHEIDEIVKGYQACTDEKSKQLHRAGLLKAFHKYFMKYVSLLKGTIGGIDSNDTMNFLSLFSSGEGRTSTDYLGIYHWIARVCSQLDEEDIYNELVVIFIDLLDKFKFVPEVSFSRYITQYMRWSIKSWVMDMSKNPIGRSPATEEAVDLCQDNTTFQGPHVELPNLDLAWVFDTNSSLFSILTTYERFLLYLNFKEGLGVRQISERLGRAKDTIHSHIQQAIQKLRDNYEKGE
jgi:RNA polymerase sigma factor (sigma-70 family)